LSTIRRIHRRSNADGQVIVLLAGGLATLLIVAALAFDVGMVLVERRDEQNAADAASLAGARYAQVTDTFSGTCPASGASSGLASVDAACTIARTNGFDHDADANEQINVYTPALHGRYTGLKGFIEVQIDATRPSIFAGIIGRTAWPVGAYAVATNAQNLTFSFGMMALDPTACKAIAVEGTGNVNSFGSIQSNSNGSGCTTGGDIGFSRTGGSTINVYGPDATCRSAGGIQDQGSGEWIGCTKAANSFALPDPLRNLPAPPKPALAPAMVLVPGQTSVATPNYCPGALSPKQPLESRPSVCDVGGNGSSYANKAWILYPGLYPGGLSVTNGATAYLMPGVYWIGGGGLVVRGGGSIFTIATETNAAVSVASATWGGGALIYNSKLSTAAGDAGNSAGGPID
jgi:hypothetical protein